MPDPDRPNVLVLMDDEHRPDVVGYAGDDVVRTPNIDRLADTGTVFTNAYSPAPACVPARHCMRTGQLPRTWDEAGFEAFEAGYGTYSRHFSQRGYQTTSGGKEHYPGSRQMQGWNTRIGRLNPSSALIERDDPEWFEGFRGFSDWKWSDPKEIKRAGVVESPGRNGLDNWVVDGVEQYVANYFSDPYYDRHTPDRPLVLKTSLIQPHYPFFADEDRFSYYLNRVDPYVEDPADVHPGLINPRHRVRPDEDVSEREIRRATAAYYAMVEAVDEQFGRVLDALEHHGEDLDEWVIVVTSDHGEMLGQHGAWQKSTFYEGGAGVPLVIRYPERFEPSTVEENVTLCDLYATLCDLAGFSVPDGLDSRSLVPLMEGNADWRNEAIAQTSDNGSVLNGVTDDHLMIKHGALKYQYYGEDADGGSEVLFDLERDPEETTDVIDDPEYAEAVDRFRERRRELGYGPDAASDHGTGYEWDEGYP